MKLKERVVFIDQKLEELYPDPPIPLDHVDPYTLLIAVLLSAQCTDARVNKVTPALFKLASTPEEMAQRSVDEINAIVRPCGLAPRKAKAIHELSHLLIKLHKAQVPESMDALEALPGVGHKTASVVMAQAFGVSSFPVDTHIHRERLEAPFCRRQMEFLTSTNYLLRTRVLSGSCLSRLNMSHLQNLFPGAKK